jgi:hypothetical protein
MWTFRSFGPFGSGPLLYAAFAVVAALTLAALTLGSA